MVKKMKNKLKSQTGESISETLIALLIAAFALVMLAGAISSAASIITTSRKTMEEYYSPNGSDPGTTEAPETATVQIDFGGSAEQEAQIQYSVESKFGDNGNIIAYKYFPSDTVLNGD